MDTQIITINGLLNSHIGKLGKRLTEEVDQLQDG